ncbi:dihydrodiol dehydrogenase / D-xylose 2-dehydrogenase (NADP) [Pseudohyphozyma bogoriensis]|nr:dihydrodiol dehydrogenase / D-xylose 2-dehydrogenase (NADP) [Pseudohyphozyma bogoriensis]
MAYTLNWGIISTGWIASEFAKETVIDPSTREVKDVAHKVVAVSSRSEDKANAFIDTWLSKATGPRAKAHGDIHSLLADANVQAVYIASPNTLHFEYCKLAIKAGKGVLLEKPATVNASQAKILFDLAKEHNVFLMEAAWTHFLPAAHKTREIIDSGVLGDIKHVSSCYFLELNVNELLSDVRLDPASGGGSLLDVGPYAWVWLYLTVYRATYGATPAPGPLPVPTITSQMTRIKYDDPNRSSGEIDESVLALMSFPPSSPEKNTKSALFHTSFNLLPATNAPCCTVFGSKGKLTMDFPAPRPSKITLETHGIKKGPGVPWVKDDVKIESWDYDMPGGARGFVFEMDEVARCLRDGKRESEIVPGRATILAMEVFDTIREQGGLKYADTLEAF